MRRELITKSTILLAVFLDGAGYIMQQLLLITDEDGTEGNADDSS